MGTYGEELSVLLFPSMAACGRLATMVGELYYKNPNNEHALTHNWETDGVVASHCERHPGTIPHRSTANASLTKPGLSLEKPTGIPDSDKRAQLEQLLTRRK